MGIQFEADSQDEPGEIIRSSRAVSKCTTPRYTDDERAAYHERRAAILWEAFDRVQQRDHDDDSSILHEPREEELHTRVDTSQLALSTLNQVCEASEDKTELPYQEDDESQDILASSPDLNEQDIFSCVPPESTAGDLRVRKELAEDHNARISPSACPSGPEFIVISSQEADNESISSSSDSSHPSSPLLLASSQ